MTHITVNEDKQGFLAQYGSILISVLILVGLMLPPVKKLLNAIPNLWLILYPVLTIFSLYFLIQVIQAKGNVITIIKWCILLASAAAMGAAVFGMGAGFFTLGRTAAVVFIILELGSSLYEILH